MIDTFNACDADSQQKYIKIKTIYLGVTSSGTTVDPSLFHDVQTHSITMQEDVDEQNLKHFVENADIVFLVADLAEDLVVKNILTIIEILSKHKKLFTTILANVDSEDAYKTRIMEEVRQKSSLLIVENQDDISIKNETSIAQIFKKIIYVLCDLIDVEIKEIRVHETTHSSLMSLNLFFSNKSELYLYLDYTEEQASIEVKQRRQLSSLLEKSTQIWISHPFIKEDQVFTREIYDLIEFFESNIDEDAACFLSPKTYVNQYTKETKVSVLISVSNNM